MKYAAILLLFILSSCEKEAMTGKLKMAATYQTSFGKLGDNGATVYVFKDVNFGNSNFSFDGAGNITIDSKVIKYDQLIVLNNLGMGEVNLEYGTYGLICVSEHIKNGTQKSWIGFSVDFSSSDKDANFDF